MKRWEVRLLLILGPVGAIRALRLNYRWSGVRIWLGARHDRPWSRCVGRGWWLVLRHPHAVVGDQVGLAEGVFI